MYDAESKQAVFMIKAPPPADEKRRLADLRDLSLLDTPPEERFDRITRIAQRVFKVPIALVSLVDRDRQWFKSRQGLAAAETPRDVSFCAHTILGHDIMVVPDAKLDPRFQDNPLVSGDPFIRFYAGCPLNMKEGRKAGTLCVIDRKPRSLSPADFELLSDLASLVEDELDAGERNKALVLVREKEAELKDFLENANDLIQISSPDGKILFANRAWRQWLRYGDQDLEALDLFDILPPEEHAKARKHLSKIRLGETVHSMRTVLLAKTGARVPVEGTINCRFKDRVPHRIRIVFRDISQRLKMEEMKNEAVALASHELRGPLQCIMNSLELLQGNGGAERPRTRKLVQTALVNVNFMLEILNDYLDLHKIEAGEPGVRLASVDLVSLARETLGARRPQGKLRFSLETRLKRAPVQSDRKRLTQVMGNLISNAVKYSPEDGLIRVKIESVGRAFRVSVVDQGPGISPAFREKIFTKFAQAGTPHQKKGTGLGLSLCKAIVESLGGKIGFESRDGRGSSFFFDLPARAESKA